MNRFVLLQVLLLPLATGAAVLCRAEPLTQSGYDAAKERIANTYTRAMERCHQLDSANGRTVGEAADQSAAIAQLALHGSSQGQEFCAEDAYNKQKVALARLEYRMSPTEENHTKLQTARTDAAYDAAKQKCADASKDEHAECMKRAKDAQADATAEDDTDADVLP